jgi:spermidine/putrescine transport system ATP-binding protein
MPLALSVKNLVKRYGRNVVALNGVSFDVDKGDFFVIIGPSGCGKSTLLRCVAGILDYDSGDIHIDGRNMKGVPAHTRNISYMPESYALFPHMRVYDNVAFRLRMQNFDESEIKKEVNRALELVGLAGFEERWPSELSGGQKQRVALARAVVGNPSLLLLDEPLSHVDYRLQRKLMEDFKNIHKNLGNTWILTTHIQEQGLSLADTLMVMNVGVIEQKGKPNEIYETPRTVFAARFVGDINLFSGQVVEQKGELCVVKTNLGEFKGVYKGTGELVARMVAYGVRPNHILISPAGEHRENSFKARLIGAYYFGEFIEYLFEVPGGVQVKVHADPMPVKLGEEYAVSWDTARGIILDKPSVIEGLNIEDAIYGR